MAGKSINDLREQHAKLERQIAEASLAPSEAYTALLGSPEVSELMTAVTNAVEPLDDATKKRVAMFVKMHADLVTLANLQLAQIRKLTAPVADQA